MQSRLHIRTTLARTWLFRWFVACIGGGLVAVRPCSCSSLPVACSRERSGAEEAAVCSHTDGSCDVQEEHEDQSLLALRLAKRPPKRLCLKYSVSFPANLNGKGVSDISMRYASLGMTTAELPLLSGPNFTGDGFKVTFNGFNGDQQISGFGFDQYTIHLGVPSLNGSLAEGDPNYTVSGFFPNAAWVRLEVTYGKQEVVRYDMDALKATLSCGTPAPNPFAKGSPAVLSYAGQASCVAKSGRKLQGKTSTAQIASVPSSAPSPTPCEATNTEVYRASADVTKQAQVSVGSDSKCSDEFVFSPGFKAGEQFSRAYNSTIPEHKSYNFTHGYIKFKIPVFINNFKERVYKGLKSASCSDGYDLAYFSVSSNFLGEQLNMPFTVNSLMLAAQARNCTASDDLAYILFAPVQEVKSMLEPGATTPPVVWVPGLNRFAYVLQSPDYLWLFRYRGSSPSFQGSPKNLQCFSNLLAQLAHPATCKDMGPYKPQITRVDGMGSLDKMLASLGWSAGKEHA